jgi:hypothetical protein
MFLLTGDVSYFNAVKSVLLAQIKVVNADASIRTRWNPARIKDQNPFFFIGDWVCRMAISFDFTKHGSYTDSERNDILDFLEKWAILYNLSLDATAKAKFVDQISYNLKDTSRNNITSELFYDGGNKIPLISFDYNNRVCSNAKMVGIVGSLLEYCGHGSNHGSLVTTAVTHMKEWIRFSTSTEGAYGEMEREGEKGLAYGAINFTSYLMLSEIRARLQDNSLYEYSTLNFLPGNTAAPYMYGSSKSIWKVLKWYSSIITRNPQRAYGGSVLDGVDGSVESYHDINFSIGTRYLKKHISEADANYLIGIYTRTGAGTRPRPAYSVCRRHGEHIPFSGVWNVYPSVPVMFYELEDKVNPYNIAQEEMPLEQLQSQPNKSINGMRLEANKFVIISDLGSNPIALDNHVDFSEGSALRLWDAGDKVSLSVPDNIQSGTYELKYRIRTGYYTDATATSAAVENKTAYLSGYEFKVNDVIVPFVLDTAEPIVKTAAFGKSFWAIVKASVKLKAGDKITTESKSSWLGIDYCDINPITLDKAYTLDELKAIAKVAGTTVDEVIANIKATGTVIGYTLDQVKTATGVPTATSLDDAIEKTKEISRVSGYNSGYSIGKTEGYTSGKLDGFADGKTAGIAEGIATTKSKISANIFNNL